RTPTATGTVNLTVSVTDSAGAVLTSSYTVLVSAAPAIAPTTLPAGDAGVLYNRVLTVSNGTTPYTVLTVTNYSAGTTGLAAPTANLAAGTVTASGSPTGAGTATFTVNATDTAGGSLSRSYTITLNPALTIAPTVLPAGDV